MNCIHKLVENSKVVRLVIISLIVCSTTFAYGKAEGPIEEVIEDAIIEEAIEDAIIEEAIEDAIIEEAIEDAIIEEAIEDAIIEGDFD